MAENRSLRTLNQRPRPGEMIKPAELIEITGVSNSMSLTDRRTYNALVHNAFGPTMAVRGQEFRIPISELRGRHKGNERISDTIKRLMQTVVTVRLEDGRTRRVQLLGGNDMDDEDRPGGMLTYTFDHRLVAILKNSTVFGKLEIAVMMAFTSSYALALYEAVARRYRMKESTKSEKLNLDQFREMIGVAPGKLETFGNLNLKAIKPAVAEINALAAFRVDIEPITSGRKVTGVSLTWWGKTDEELRDAWDEVHRPKLGRRARISGTVEVLAPERITSPKG